MRIIQFHTLSFNLTVKTNILKRFWYWLINKHLGSLWIEVNKQKSCLGHIYYRRRKGTLPCKVFLRDTDTFKLSFNNQLNAEIEALINPLGVAYDVEEDKQNHEPL